MAEKILSKSSDQPKKKLPTERELHDALQKIIDSGDSQSIEAANIILTGLVVLLVERQEGGAA